MPFTAIPRSHTSSETFKMMISTHALAHKYHLIRASIEHRSIIIRSLPTHLAASSSSQFPGSFRETNMETMCMQPNTRTAKPLE